MPRQSGRGNIVGTSCILPEVGCEAAPSHVHLGFQGGSKPNLFSCKRCGQPVSVEFSCNAGGICLIRMPTKLRKDRLWTLFVLPDGVHFWWCPCSVQDLSFLFCSLQHCTCNEARMFRLRRLFPCLCLFWLFLRGCLQVFQLPNVRRFTSDVPCMCWWWLRIFGGVGAASYLWSIWRGRLLSVSSACCADSLALFWRMALWRILKSFGVVDLMWCFLRRLLLSHEYFQRMDLIAEVATLARLWDAKGLLHIHNPDLGAARKFELVRALNFLKSFSVDRQIGGFRDLHQAF